MSPPKEEMKGPKQRQNVADELNQLKQQIKSNLESIALTKFGTKVEQFKLIRKTLIKEIDVVRKKNWACTIPVPESLSDNFKKIQLQPDSLQSLVTLNVNLQCTQLSRIPMLLKNCSMPTNKEVAELIDKVMPHLVELEADLIKLDYALRLMLPRMREGEYLGIELLQEVIETVQGFQESIQGKVCKKM